MRKHSPFGLFEQKGQKEDQDTEKGMTLSYLAVLLAALIFGLMTFTRLCTLFALILREKLPQAKRISQEGGFYPFLQNSRRLSLLLSKASSKKRTKPSFMHILRIFNPFKVEIGSFVLPLWASYVFVVVGAYISLFLFLML